MRSLQNGQALLIVLLSMAVVLTVVLSILSRSVTDIAVTSRGEESIRAFSAAEAGVEQALVSSGGNIQGNFQGTSANYSANITQIGQGATSFAYPSDVSAGDTATIWFLNHDDQGNPVCDGSHLCYTNSTVETSPGFEICWGKTTTSANSATAPAIEVAVYYLGVVTQSTSVRVARAAFDPNTARTPPNGFTQSLGACSSDGKSYPFHSNFTFRTSSTPGLVGLGIPNNVTTTQNGLLFMSIRFLYNNEPTPFSVHTLQNTFPPQGKVVESTGASGESTRKVQAIQLFSDIPPVFQSAVFSPNAGVSK